MPGKHCGNKVLDGAPKIRETRAFCEGRLARSLSATPVNPHPVGSTDGLAWQSGVDSKVAAEPDGCCAPTGPAAGP